MFFSSGKERREPLDHEAIAKILGSRVVGDVAHPIAVLSDPSQRAMVDQMAKQIREQADEKEKGSE